MINQIWNISAPKTTKEQIVLLLSKNWPLSAREIHNQLLRQFGSHFTYQATHKTIGEMLNENYLLKESKKYSLNALKIAEAKRALEEIENKLAKASVPSNSGSEVFFFNSFKEWGNKTLQLLSKNTSLESTEKWFIFQDFTISLLTMSKEEYDWFSRVTSCGGFIIYKGNTLMDRLINGLWEKSGFKTKKVKSFHSPYTIFVRDDYIYQTIFPTELKNKFKKIYKKTKKIEEISTEEYYQTYYGPATIQLNFIKNPELAAQLKKEIKKYFK